MLVTGTEGQGIKLSRYEKLGYGMGGIILGITMSLSNYLTVYLTNAALLDIAVVSTILAVSRIFDGISDILVGNLIDNTRTIHGKARVWIRRVSLPFAVSAVLMFYVPKAWPDGMKYVYVFFAYNLFTSVFATLFIISHNALLSLMTSDGRELRQLSSMAVFLQRAALMCISAVFVKLLLVFTDVPQNPMTQKAFTCVVTVIGVLAAVICLAEFYLTRERAETTEPASSQDAGTEKTKTRSVSERPAQNCGKTGFRTRLKQLLSNKYWVIMLIASVVVYSAGSCFDGAMSYYTLYILEDFEAMTLFHLVTGSGAIAATIVLIAASPRAGTAKLFIISLIIRCAGIAGIYLAGKGNRALLIISLAIVGIGNASASVFMQALITETLVYTKKTGGELIPGLGNAGMNAARKFGLGLSMAVFGFIMAAAGFDAGLDAQGIPQPDSVIRAINTGFIWAPIVFYIIIIIVFLLFFDMEKRRKDIA